MKSSLLNRNSQDNPYRDGMKSPTCQLIHLKVPPYQPLVIAGKACYGAHCPGTSAGRAWNDGTTGVISWAKGGRAMVDEHGRVGNVLGFHCFFFFRRETKPWNLCRMFVTGFFFGKDGDFWETTRICLKFFLVWECFRRLASPESNCKKKPTARAAGRRQTWSWRSHVSAMVVAWRNWRHWLEEKGIR